MIILLKTLATPIASLVLLMMGSGYFMSFIAIRLELQGASNELIGAVASAFYGGILLGSIWSHKWIERLGHAKVLASLSGWIAVSILMMALWIDPVFWITIRFLAGIGVGALFVVIESWFLLASSPSMRSRALSVYLTVFYAALSSGQLLVGIEDPNTYVPFFLAAILCTLAILPILLMRMEVPCKHHDKSGSLWRKLWSSPKGFLGGVVSGMVLASIYGLGPAYAGQIGLTVDQTGIFMAVLIFGGLSLQWPLGRHADHASRKKVLLFASLMSAFFSLLLALFDGVSWPLLLILSWLFGGVSYVIYPLSMAFTCETLEEHEIIAATGGFVLAYSIGAILGPLIGSLFMSWVGSAGLFYFISLICMVLSAVGTFPLRKK